MYSILFCNPLIKPYINLKGVYNTFKQEVNIHAIHITVKSV